MESHVLSNLEAIAAQFADALAKADDATIDKAMAKFHPSIAEKIKAKIADRATGWKSEVSNAVLTTLAPIMPTLTDLVSRLGDGECRVYLTFAPELNPSRLSKDVGKVAIHRGDKTVGGIAVFPGRPNAGSKADAQS